MIKVIGVRTTNEKAEGGRNRQDILKEFFDAGNKKIIVNAEYDKLNNEIRIRSAKTNELLGSMCRKTTNSMMKKEDNPKQYVGIIDYHGYYYLKLVPKN